MSRQMSLTVTLLGYRQPDADRRTVPARPR